MLLFFFFFQIVEWLKELAEFFPEFISLTVERNVTVEGRSLYLLKVVLPIVLHMIHIHFILEEVATFLRQQTLPFYST